MKENKNESSESRNKSKMKAKEILTGIIVGLCCAFILIYIKNIIKDRFSSINTFKQHIIYNYYRPELLDMIFKNNLGDDYTGDISTDFDIFLMKSLYNEINKYELEHNQIYNSYFSKERLMSYSTNGDENAKELYGKSINNNTYYLKIPQFRDGITYKYFKQYKDDMLNYNNLIIDLRNNTGGEFDDFERISSIFLKEGSEIYRLYKPKETIVKKSTNKNPAEFKNIVILTNNYTASVSELFILSLIKNLDNVTLIGTNTHGKDISCNIKKLSNNSGFIYITSYMKGPNSSEISSQGIAPDIYVGNTEDFYNSLNNPDKEKELREKDLVDQYESAVNFLLNSK